MEYQVPIDNFPPKFSILDYQFNLYQRKNVTDILKICSNYPTSLILFIAVLVWILSKAKTDTKQISTWKKTKINKKIPMAKLLSPIRLPVLDSIYTMVKFRNDGIQFLEQATEKFGNLFEVPFGPFTFILVSDPVIIQKLLSSPQLAYINRPKIYKSIFSDVFHIGLLTSENEIWHAQRKMLGRSFTYKSLQTYATFMNTQAANLTRSLVHGCKDNNGIEVQRFNQLLCCHTFRIIAQIVMGTDSLSLDESNEIANNFNCWRDLASEKILNPWKYLWFSSKRRRINRFQKSLNNCFVKVTQKYKKEYEQTKIASSVHKSIDSGEDCNCDDESVGIKPFRCMIEEMICTGASDQEICQQVATILATGHDTTKVAIRMLILHLALNPEHQVACREEVDKVINKKGYNLNTNNGSDEINYFDLTMEDLHDLKYLERCILESCRITPIIPLFFRRIDAPLKIDDDLEFPAGTDFVIANWTLHRDPQVYADPLKFDPDRFLAENVKKRHPYSYTAFSMGPRNCIGSKVAIMQIKVLVSYIVRHFEIFSDDKLKNVRFHFGITIVPERDYKITFKRRELQRL